MRALLTCHGRTISAGFGGLAMPVQEVVKKSSVKKSTLRLRACPLVVVGRTIRNRSENRPESNGRSRLVGKLVEESDTSGNLQGICRISCKTLQILSGNLQGFSSSLNGLGVFHRRIFHRRMRRARIRGICLRSAPSGRTKSKFCRGMAPACAFTRSGCRTTPWPGQRALLVGPRPH
jgi:hypothetical protein